MKHFFVLSMLAIFFVNFSFGQKKVEHYFKFEVENKAELRKLTRVISIDNVEGNTVYAYANSSEMTKFKSLGYKPVTLTNPSKLATYLMATTKEQMRDWDSYPTYEAYVAMMNQFATDYPNLCTVESIGNTVEGRELLVAKISANVATDGSEPEVFYTSTMHGDETVGYVLMIRLIDYLLSNYGIDSRVTTMVDNLEIYINPNGNPDGTYAGGNSSVSSATRSNANGVDLNRNFPDPEYGPTYGTPNEPEIKAMTDFAEERNFILSGNFHSGIELVNYPWDTWTAASPDNHQHPDNDWFFDVSTRYATSAHSNSPSGYFMGQGNGVTNGGDWYVVNGGRQDYMNFYQNCREVTFELSDIKILPASQLSAHWDYNYDAFLGYLEECLYGIQGTVTNTSGDALVATIEVEGHDVGSENSTVISEPTTGSYCRLIESGTYSLTFSAYGYISQTISNVEVTDFNETTLNVVLEPAATISVNGTVTDENTNLAIVGARIDLINSPLDAVFTNANGVYSIEMLENSYEFHVSKFGYATASQSVSVSATNNVVNFQLQPSTAESFELGVLSAEWETAGDSDWTIDPAQAYDGTYSMRSGEIDDNEITTLQIEMNVTQSGVLSFWKKVSSEDGYDFLKFYIDNDLQGSGWSGAVSWSEETYNISTGTHTFKWEYSKDNSTLNGSDCAWVDYINFPPHEAPSTTLNITPSSISHTMNGSTTESDVITLENTGSGYLQYILNVDDAEIAQWVSFDALGGVLATQTEEITVSFQAPNVTQDYSFNVVATNLNNSNEILIPVSIVVSSVSGIDDISDNISVEVYPNPFGNSTQISFCLSTETKILAEIYSLDGKLIKILSNKKLQSGNNKLNWDGSNKNNQPCANGIYVLKLSGNDVNIIQKIVKLK